MHKTIWRTAVAVILTAGVGSPVGLAASPRLYQNQRWQFQVAAPEQWFVTPAEAELLKARYANTGLVVVFSESSLERAKSINPTCTFSVERLPAATKTKEQILGHIRSVIGDSTGMKVRSPLGELPRKDCLAAQVQYEYQHPSGIALVARVTALVAPAKTHYIIITATAPAGSFPSYGPLFERVVSSFAFVPAS